MKDEFKSIIDKISFRNYKAYHHILYDPIFDPLWVRLVGPVLFSKKALHDAIITSIEMYNYNNERF